MATSLILLVWATSLVFILFRTKKSKSSFSATLMVATLFITAILHRLYGDVGCLFIFAGAITFLLIRPTPIGYIDKWNKHKLPKDANV